MKSSKACLVLALISLMTPAAMGQPSLPGKTCRGIFQIPDAPSSRREGAFQIRFAGTPEKPTAHIWRGFGSTVWQAVSQEINSGTLSQDLSGFEDMGEARQVDFDNGQVSLSTRAGAKIVLMFDQTSPRVYDGNGLVSTPAPGEPAGRMDWRGATAHVLCQ